MNRRVHIGVLSAAVLLYLFMMYAACKSTEHRYENLPDDQLIIGSGGGISGTFTDYHILENGQVFVVQYPSNKVTQMHIKKKQAKALYARWEQDSLQHVDMDQRGNYTFYVERITADSSAHRISWPMGNASSKPTKLYQEFMDLVAEQNSQ